MNSMYCKSTEMINTLTTFKSEKKYVSLLADFGGEEYDVQGYIIDISNLYVCMIVVCDWHFDGYLLIRTEYISDIKSGEIECFNQTIIEKEEILKNVEHSLKWLKLDDNKNLIDSLKKNINVVQIECLLPNISNYALGEIKSVEHDSLILQGYDATAVKEDGLYNIPYQDISIIKFLDEYTLILQKYFKNKS